MGNKPLDAEEIFRGMPSYISRNQNVQGVGMKVNPWKAKYWYSNPDVFPFLLHGIVLQ